MTDATELSLITHVAALDPASDDFATTANVLGLIADAKRRLNDLQREAEAVGVEQLRRMGSVTIGETRYFAGASKSYKPRNIADAAEAVSMACGGDWPRFTDCLSSGALKPGACRKLFEEAGAPERFDAVFETVTTWGVEQKPKLQKINLAFVKGE